MAILLGIAGFVTLLPQPELWAEGSPASCPANFQVESISLTNWETGLGAWTVDTYDVYQPDAFDTPDWATVGGLPDGRQGTAAFVQNINEGNCTTDDESGVLTLTSPVIAIPVQADGPRIALNHWFDIEHGWDGGNLKISVNGGAFTLVPGSAFETGPYTDVLFEAIHDFLPYNTNPLAEQEAFTGSGLQLDGASWRVSRVNLDGIAGPGDSIRLRFDFGIDGCNGVVGWYVDEVEIFSCGEQVSPTTPSLTVVKQVVNDDGGSATVTDFSITTSAGDLVFDGGSAVDDTTTYTANQITGLTAGVPYTLVESDFEGYSEGSWNCSPNAGGGAFDSGSITLEPGEVATCTIVNDDQAPSLTIVKQVINNNGGTSVPSDWTLIAEGPSGFSGRGPSVSNPAEFEPGDYVLAESSSIDGYMGSAWTCEGGTLLNQNTVRVESGANVTCTIRNHDIEPSLTLVKQVVNDDGGTAEASDWTLSASGPSGFSGQGPTVSNGSGFVAGTYVLSETGGPSGYTAGNWSCNDGNQLSRNSVKIEPGDSVTCTITNNDFDSSTAINVGHNGAWFNPDTSGQGILIDVDPTSNYMFIAWFAYTNADSAYPFEQRWLTAQGEFDGNRAELVLYETLGGRFDDPTTPETLPIGSVSMVFGGCEDAYVSYQFDTEGLMGEFPLIRAIPGSAEVCESKSEERLHTVDINSGIDGAWFDPNTAGQGFLIDARPDPVNGDFMFVAWFTYGDTNTSGQWWLTAQGPFEGSSADIPVFETTGGSFDDPLPPSTNPVGQMQIKLNDCNSATLSYSIPDRTLQGEIELIRVIPGTDALCREISSAD